MRIETEKPALAEVDMTPMIDIVFQLIAFFMLITNFEQTQADERVKLPKDELAKPPETAREAELVFNVGYRRDEAGEKIDPAAVLFYAGEEIPIHRVGPILEREAFLRREEGKDPGGVTFVIRADRETPTGLVQEIIKLAQEAGFEKFALSATQQRRF